MTTIPQRRRSERVTWFAPVYIHIDVCIVRVYVHCVKVNINKQSDGIQLVRLTGVMEIKVGRVSQVRRRERKVQISMKRLSFFGPNESENIYRSKLVHGTYIGQNAETVTEDSSGVTPRQSGETPINVGLGLCTSTIKLSWTTFITLGHTSTPQTQCFQSKYILKYLNEFL